MWAGAPLQARQLSLKAGCLEQPAGATTHKVHLRHEDAVHCEAPRDRLIVSHRFDEVKRPGACVKPFASAGVFTHLCVCVCVPGGSIQLGRVAKHMRACSCRLPATHDCCSKEPGATRDLAHSLVARGGQRHQVTHGKRRQPHAVTTLAAAGKRRERTRVCLLQLFL